MICMINDIMVTMTMRKSLVTCHALWVTSSLTLVCTVQSSSLTLCKVQSRVWDKDGPGEIYCPDICPYNSCPAVQYFPYNTSTMASELPYNAPAARLCALCPPRTTLPAAYLPILIESDEGQIEKALNTRMFRCCL